MSLLRVDSDGEAVEDVSMLFEDARSAMASYEESVLVIEAPPNVRIGWTFDGQEWHEPYQEGKAYDAQTDTLIPHERYRRVLHERTTNDTMQAYRKLRQGDQTIDWQAWLDALDAYNVAIEETQNQEGYPDTVVYPEYPTRPSPGDLA